VALSESIFDQPLYRCWFLSNEFPLTSCAESIVSRNQGDVAVARLGTHVVEAADFGGSLLLSRIRHKHVFSNMIRSTTFPPRSVQRFGD